MLMIFSKIQIKQNNQNGDKFQICLHFDYFVSNSVSVIDRKEELELCLQE